MEPIEKLFWGKVDIKGPDDCWEWQAGRFSTGYGSFSTRGLLTTLKAHRISWFFTHGPIPEGLWVLHKCDNRPCCNPKHLFLGTARDNTRDMMVKKRFLPQGQSGWRNILTQEDKLKILKDERTQKEISIDYGISRTLVSKIKCKGI